MQMRSINTRNLSGKKRKRGPAGESSKEIFQRTLQEIGETGIAGFSLRKILLDLGRPDNVASRRWNGFGGFLDALAWHAHEEFNALLSRRARQIREHGEGLDYILTAYVTTAYRHPWLALLPNSRGFYGPTTEPPKRRRKPRPARDPIDEEASDLAARANRHRKSSTLATALRALAQGMAIEAAHETKADPNPEFRRPEWYFVDTALEAGHSLVAAIVKKRWPLERTRYPDSGTSLFGLPPLLPDGGNQ